jgi:hypothetical protein
VEKQAIELIRREPFVPFVVEMMDGSSLIVPHPSWRSMGRALVSSDWMAA